MKMMELVFEKMVHSIKETIHCDAAASENRKQIGRCTQRPYPQCKRTTINMWAYEHMGIWGCGHVGTQRAASEKQKQQIHNSIRFDQHPATGNKADAARSVPTLTVIIHLSSVLCTLFSVICTLCSLLCTL